MIEKVDDLYAQHAEIICDDRLEQWPELYADECVYKIISRVNYERSLPVGVIFAESKGALIDRVTAIRNTMVFSPRYLTHLIGSVRIVGEKEGVLDTRSQFAVYQTLVDGTPELQLLGRTFDQIDASGEALKFKSRFVVFDNELVPGSVVYPV
ncbi:aromatic-ring-hydroxylating dioxygenase subunit beta [Paraburkholderia tuberum]|uniref:Anthranilate 1,2-dioxygenase small subunit/salicylate 5-hydroxylase small subunit n=1 Tax=Paraburkholderia tuberum TaxID=157910 RepID=A0A1H1KH28_9BURK|nr:aromatic-ring-hydroxylating dioxygenase subunit beta [Paraburkholderia tuberum]SDR61546.1 anthranilate 1,2-dioxygenase small subunit/salicylate 5-hydroxylase small subunit [Paraburkholderia tuberum]